MFPVYKKNLAALKFPMSRANFFCSKVASQMFRVKRVKRTNQYIIITKKLRIKIATLLNELLKTKQKKLFFCYKLVKVNIFRRTKAQTGIADQDKDARLR
jgi:hypothetical protein